MALRLLHDPQLQLHHPPAALGYTTHGSGALYPPRRAYSSVQCSQQQRTGGSSFAAAIAA